MLDFLRSQMKALENTGRTRTRWTHEEDFSYSRSLIDSPFSLPAGLAVPGNTTGQHLIDLIFMYNDVKNSS